MVSVREAYYDTDHEFTQDDDLMFAFGLTAYDSNQEPIEDAQYGILKAYYKTWGGVVEGSQSVHFQELETKQCTRAELGLPKEDWDTESDYSKPPLFFEPHPNAVSDFEFYFKKFKCIQKEKLRIQGDYNSARTRSLVLEFDKCQETPENPIKCKSDDEILQWLRRKFILIYSNGRRFQMEEFGVHKIIEEARTTWVPINS